VHPNVESGAELLKRILSERKKKWEEKNPGRKYKEPVEPDTSNLPELPKGWVWATTDQLLSFVTSGSRGWAKYYSETGSLFLRMGNLDHDTINLDLADIQHVNPPEGAEGTRTRVMSGDILISITADVGMVGFVPDNFEEAFINQHVALARPGNSIHNEYLAWFLSSKNAQDQLKDLQRGATKVGLGLDDIRAVNVPLPPPTEQNGIIEEIDRCFSVVKEVQISVESNIKRGERLRQRILKKAFSGRLG
jgi:type I restriction enzyme S subunit